MPANLDATQTSELSASRIKPGDRLASRYQIERLLGVGAMGEVFEARDLDLDVTVALKVLRPELVNSADAMARFRQELLTARRVGHPNVIRLHDMVRDGDRWLLSMEFVEGQSLEAKLTSESSLPVEEAVDLARQLAAGLAAAHDAGVVHRDLKPANILLTHDGRATISDFGIARSLSHAGLTRDGLIVGTPDYLSPEQAAGEPVDGRSDLYALGIILCEMLTGKLPFNATTAQEAIGQRLAKSPTPLSGRDDLPGWLVRVCHRLLRRNVRRRYQSAREVLADLEAEGRVSGPKRWWLPAAAALLAALGIGVWQWRQRAPVAVPPPPELTVIAILPAVDAPDDATALAVAGVLGDRMAGIERWRTISPVRVATVLKLLQFDARSVPDHLPRIGQELGADLLVLPGWTPSGADIRFYRADRDFASEPSPPPDLLAALGGSPAKAPAAGWAGSAAFYAGLALLEQGNATEAVAPLTRATQVEAGAPQHWWALGRALESLGRNDAAQDAALQAGSRAVGDGRYDELARVWQALATGDYDTADERMGALQQRFPNDPLVLSVAAEYWGDAGDLMKADSLLLRLLELQPEHARGWFLLAKFAILRGESQKALDEYLVRALTLHNRLRNPQGRADVINAQGIAYEQLGQLDAAVASYGQAAALRNQIGDLRGEAATLRNLAAVEAVRGNTELADAHLEQARIRLESLNDLAGMADLYNDAGVLAEERGAHTEALEQYRQALEIRRRLPNQRSLAESLGNVGFLSFELGQYNTARAYLQQALELSEKTGDQAGQVHARQNLALLEVATGELEAAAQRLEEAQHVARSLQMSQELAVNHTVGAELNLRRGRYADALETISRARAAFELQDDNRGLAQTRLVAAEIYLAMGGMAEAAEQLSGFLGEVANDDQRRKGRLFEAALSVESGDAEAALAILDGFPGEGQVNGLRSAMLATRARRAEGAEHWRPLVERAESLAHWPLLLEVSRYAMRAALNRGDDDRARQLFESRWPLLAPLDTAQEKPHYAALTDALCPVAGRSCEDWAGARDQIWQAAVSQLPEDFVASYTQRVAMP